MRKVLSISLLLIAGNLYGQVANPEFEAVAKKFEAGKYESALETVEALIDNDNHKKKPEPYLWASMCLFELSKSDNPKTQELYKGALRDALKYAGKAFSKDKNGNIVSNNQEYFNTMRKEGLAYAQQFMKENNVRKAQYTYKQLLEFLPNDAHIQFIKGVSDLRLSNVNDAERDIKASYPVLEQTYRNLDYQPDPQVTPILKEEVTYYLDHLIQSNYLDSARTVGMVARIIFPLDENLKGKLAELK
jgi:hypothetical protein